MRTLTLEEQGGLALDKLVVTAKVRGNPENGVRPYVELDRVRYTNQVLARMPSLIRKALTIHINKNDYRQVHAFLPSGAELGILTARGRWGTVPHTCAERRLVNRLKERGLIHYTSNQDPIHVLLAYLGQEMRHKAGLVPKGRKGASGRLESPHLKGAANLFTEVMQRRQADVSQLEFGYQWPGDQEPEPEKKVAKPCKGDSSDPADDIWLSIK